MDNKRQNIRELLAPLLSQIAPEEQPFLLAQAERLAAQRYRRWAQDSTLMKHASGLKACALREEEIADLIQSLYPKETSLRLRPIFPDLEKLNQQLFSTIELNAQLALQTSGERAGAELWRNLAEQRPNLRELFLRCAALEEASADFLDSLVL